MTAYTNTRDNNVLPGVGFKDGDTLTTVNGSKWIWQNESWFPVMFAGNPDVQPLTVSTNSSGGIVFPDGVAAAIADLGSGGDPKSAAGGVKVSAFGALTDGTDQSANVSAAATFCKTWGRTLVFDGNSGDVYKFSGIDVAGLTVIASPGVSIAAPAGATGYPLQAIGTSGARITSPTKIIGIKHAGGGTAYGLFNAEYADDVLVEGCYGSGYPPGASPDASAIFLKECLRPRVVGGAYSGGRQGVCFVSCTNPGAVYVTTSGQGRDGIQFYTSPTGSTTTDAYAIACRATAYCLNGEGGRAGVHMYGVRRGQMLGCSAEDDSGQLNYDTSGLRFRDCEDFSCNGYSVKGVRTGIHATELGDYASSPHFISPRGAIGPGSIGGFGEMGICITNNVSPLKCSISGAQIKNGALVAGGTTAGAGIWHEGSGAISGVGMQDIAMRGVWVRPNPNQSGLTLVSLSGSEFLRVGVSASNLPAVAVSGDATHSAELTVSGCSFADDRGTPTSAMAIRVFQYGAATIGVNGFGSGITTRVSSEIGGIIRRGSQLIMASAGTPTGLAGTTENGTLATDTNGIVYRIAAGVWRRVDPKPLTATIGTTQTAVAHGLGYVPTSVGITPAASATVWQSQAADTTSVYLTAIASVSCQINVQ